MLTPLALLLLLSLTGDALDVLRWIVGLPEAIFHGYSWLLRWVAGSVHSLFESYGYWVIFLGTLTENTLFLGVIVPGLIVVVLGGLAAYEGSISLPLAVALGIAGTVIGDTVSYFMGRFGWSRVSQSTSIREFADRVREPLLRRGALFVLLYHFAGYTRVVGPASAGLLQMPYRRWAPFDYAGAVLWVTSFMAAGYVLGALGVSLDADNDQYFRYFEWGLLVIIMVWVYFMLHVGRQTFLGPRREDSGADEDEDEETETLEAPGR